MSWRAFERIAERYDKWYEENEDIYLAELSCLKDLLRKDGPCLEVGVGTGRFAGPLQIDVGLDAAYSPLLLAKDRGLEVVQGKAESLPFRDSSFSCVILVVTLCFLEDREMALKEIARVLNKRGLLYVCVIPSESPLGKRYSEKRGSGSIYSYAKFVSREELLSLLRSRGFLPMSECHTLIEGGVPNFLCLEAIYPEG
ncbi:MAG: class I SAM-dependent methyltransferase [Candidatus Korarchaeota archaeon]|nr:class I SAM-dependent methyltransferase [Candidatus Korarchaeota archaeon]